MLTIAFHSNQLGERGTEVALYDYAHFNELLLKNRSVIMYRADAAANSPAVVERFAKRFPLLPYARTAEIDELVSTHAVDVLYAIKAGRRDGVVATKCRTAVHAVFQCHEPHGDVYAYNSAWLSKKMSRGRLPFVPHMVHLPDLEDDLRAELGIPADAVVFGRYGGKETFDYAPGVRAVAAVARKCRDIFFVFVNTNTFCEPLPNIIHLPAIAELADKVRFINTCDAMVAARKAGETFGLAIAEFSVKNKPVIVNRICRDKAHIDMLGKKGIYYWTGGQLKRILTTFKRGWGEDWDAYSAKYLPEAVMREFAAVFLGA